jgi:putative DNA primase/helicase
MKPKISCDELGVAVMTDAPTRKNAPAGTEAIGKPNERYQFSTVAQKTGNSSGPICWETLSTGEHRLGCPACGTGRRSDRTLGVTVDSAGRGVAHCFRCSFVEVHRDSSTRQTAPRRVLVSKPEPRKALVETAASLFSRAVPVESTNPAGHYLLARGCVLPPVDGDLRWLPAHRHPSGHIGPCLVALLTDVVTREPRSLHFTWIDGGRKADVTPPRLLLKGHAKAGTVCRLWPDDSVTYGLGVAEGIETALSLAHAFKPVWACVDAGNLAGLPVLAGIETLVIAVDHDPAGVDAAAQCAARWTQGGAEVRTALAPVPKMDLNDLVQEAAL